MPSVGSSLGSARRSSGRFKSGRCEVPTGADFCRSKAGVAELLGDKLMAPRVWYRGEGVDVPVARPGTVHDFGDGTYFTDDVDVAKTYAKMRAPDPANQRVYQYSVEMGSMKVLDIESLPQWKEWLEADAARLSYDERTIHVAKPVDGGLWPARGIFLP